MRRRLFRLLAAIALLAALPMAADAQSPLIAVAANMSEPMREIATTFEGEHGMTLRLSYGSSGNFVRQIEQGAPFELFLAADEDSIDRLSRSGHAEGQGAVYAIGRLVLFTARSSPVVLDADLKGLGESLRAGAIRRLAIANPEHAPYGRAARETLQAAGLWNLAQSRLALGESIGQAAQFALSGAAEAGLIAYSLAASPAFKAKGDFVVIPEAMHAPIRQRMALLTGAGASARELFRFMSGPRARCILERYGYALPEAQ